MDRETLKQLLINNPNAFSDYIRLHGVTPLVRSVYDELAELPEFDGSGVVDDGVETLQEF